MLMYLKSLAMLYPETDSLSLGGTSRADEIVTTPPVYVMQIRSTAANAALNTLPAL